MRNFLHLLFLLACFTRTEAQPGDCVLQQPDVTINFSAGVGEDESAPILTNYRRVLHACPSDGYYAIVSSTSDCFRGDWQTLAEDHTPGDITGNMMIVNASHNSGTFLTTPISGLKPGKYYEFSVWMMNVCRPTEKCPFPLLPNINVLIQTRSGTTVSQVDVGELQRSASPQWSQFRVMFTTPAAGTDLVLTMINNAPGGCGNDFALDDIMFRECIKRPPPVTTKAKTPVTNKPKPPVTVTNPKTPAVVKKPDPVKKPDTIVRKPQTVVSKPAAPVVKKPAPVAKKPEPEKRAVPTSEVGAPVRDSSVRIPPAVTHRTPVFAPAPPILTVRTNTLIQRIQAKAGEIILKLYDNGDIDGDTVSVYHNNVLLVSHARLSEKPVLFRININADEPHHELIMVAENLGSIPPNTSMMVVNAGTDRYEVFISSNEQKNAKVVFDLKE